MNTRKQLMGLAVIASLVITGCGTTSAFKGGAIGGAAGGLLGAVIGKQAGNTALGAIIGAAVGGTTGALIGNHMDKQAEELRNDLKNAKVERVGEGIKITFDSGILFKTNAAELNATAKSNIINLAKVLNKYEDTNIVIEGHTDGDGSDEYNLSLSEKRASSVDSQLSSSGVQPARTTVKGYGEAQPIADNNTDAGKSLNRRVEIAIFANERMKKAAESGKL